MPTRPYPRHHQSIEKVYCLLQLSNVYEKYSNLNKYASGNFNFINFREPHTMFWSRKLKYFWHHWEKLTGQWLPFPFLCVGKIWKVRLNCYPKTKKLKFKLKKWSGFSERIWLICLLMSCHICKWSLIFSFLDNRLWITTRFNRFLKTLFIKPAQVPYPSNLAALYF